MNALIFVLILAFAPGATVASVGVVWLLLVVVEWLADRFADCLWRGRIYALRRSPSAAQTATMAGTGNSTARSTHVFQNGKTVEQIAREMVDRFGADAVPVLRKIAAQASAVGDHHEAAVTTPACFQKHRRYGPGSRPRHKWQWPPRITNVCDTTAARFLCPIFALIRRAAETSL